FLFVFFLSLPSQRSPLFPYTTLFRSTGKMFAIDSHFGVVPDLMTISKSLAAGMPLRAVVGRTDVMEVPGPGQLGGTFAGNPVACEAALAVMDGMEEENLCDRAEGRSEERRVGKER